MLTERQKAKIRKQNEERDKKFVESLNAEEKDKRAKYIAARDKADKLFAGFFEGKVTDEELSKAESEKEKCRKAYFGLVTKNRAKRAKQHKPNSEISVTSTKAKGRATPSTTKNKRSKK